MNTWQTAAAFLVLGCVVYFPVLLVISIWQHRELVRLRGMLENSKSAEKTSENGKPKIEEIRTRPTNVWVVSETREGR